MVQKDGIAIEGSRGTPQGGVIRNWSSYVYPLVARIPEVSDLWRNRPPKDACTGCRIWSMDTVVFRFEWQRAQTLPRPLARSESSTLNQS